MSMAGKLMSMVEQLSPMRRFYKFVVRRLIGPYIKYDLDLEQLEIKLGEGTVVLHDVELNPIAFNQMLAQTGANLTIASGVVKELCITIPWRNLLEKSCLLSVSGVDIVLSVGGAACPHQQGSAPEHEQAPDEALDDAEDSGSEGVQVLERWIEGMLSRLQITVNDVEIRIDHCSQQLNQQFFCLALRLHHLEYRDTTLEDHALNDLEDAAGLRGRPKKEIKFQQIALHLTEGESGRSDAPILSSGHADGHDDYLCVTLGSTTEPNEVELCFFMHALDCTLQPLQMVVLAELASGLMLAPNQPAESVVQPGQSLHDIGADRLSQSLRLGDFRTIEHILNVHEGVSLDQLASPMSSMEQSIMPGPEENKLFYSTIAGDSDVFSSFMHSSLHSSSSAPGSPVGGVQLPEVLQSAVSLTTKIHIEHLGIKVVLDEAGRGLLLESKIVSNSWSNQGVHWDLKANPLRVYQYVIDQQGTLSQDVIVGFGPKMNLSQDLSMSMHMLEPVPDLHFTGAPSSPGSTHLVLDAQHMYGSFTSETLRLFGQLGEAAGRAAAAFEPESSEAHQSAADANNTVKLTLPSMELNLGSSLRCALGNISIECDKQADVVLQLESAELMLLQESDDEWSRVPTTVASVRCAQELVSMQIHTNSNVAEWMAPPMGHSSNARHAMQAAAVAASPLFIHVKVPQCDFIFNSTTYATFVHLFDADDDDGAAAEEDESAGAYPLEPFRGAGA